MGTNYYIKKYMTPEQKKEVIDAINNDQYDEARDIISEVEKIHIGKRSAGWKFLWDANEFKYFEPTKESLIEWLKSGQIVDEYKREFTFEEFWNDCLDGFRDGYDAITYEKDYPGRGHWRQSCAIFHGIPVTLGEFYIDNLRFSVSNNFA